MLKLFTKEVIKPYPVPEYIILNVENFNNWFVDPNNNAVYANRGIFLRTDKLSQSHILDYVDKCFGILPYDPFWTEEKLRDFVDKVFQDWRNKINNK